ncbi:hypothetical protein VKT23_002962 [Stygiomarasmius scandens]|uniref:Histone deacetylase complex subunit SAP30 Sin3 binding domain-containing protein n=1 Tax=Marasmiellus scandens TaxID=2682957 RepID=A0ABR1JWH4_9AGAR
MSTAASVSTARRSQTRKRVANEDATYIGPSSVRQAAIEGVKRRRLVAEPANDPEPSENSISMLDLSSVQLHRYLDHYDLVPIIYPLPISAENPPPPHSLANSHHLPPPPQITPANRPRRDFRDTDFDPPEGHPFQTRAPILNDVQEVHAVLAGIAQKHFRENLTVSGRDEIDTLVAFISAVERSKSQKS